jgi:adenylate kinase
MTWAPDVLAQYGLCPGREEACVRLLLIGAPGSGKGTQAVRIAERFGITHISSGDLLRQHVRDRTPIGLTIKQYVDAGDLVPDGIVMDMLYKPVVAATERGGYVLDGFPRTVQQAEAAYDVAHRLGAHVKASIHLDVPAEELVRRLLTRSRGSEDTAEVIGHRLQVYREKTVPLLEYYGRREWLVTVDGARSEAEVHEAIVAKVSSLAPPASTH